MRWIKIISIFLLVLAAVYTGKNYIQNHKGQEVFVMEKELPYEVEKLFSQFNNFQNFTRWSAFLSEKNKYRYTYFLPYEGQGSAMKYENIQDKDDFGEMFLRYENPFRTVKYDFYPAGEERPYKVSIRFTPNGEKTKLTWRIDVPEINFWKQLFGEFSEKEINENITKSMENLIRVLSGKVERGVMLGQIKYDSIMIENQEERLLLGINVSTSNQGNNLFKNININHNKLIGFITKDLVKSDDEFGQPTLITEAGNLKNKEVSYFYSVPVSKEEQIADQNFVFKKTEKSKIYSIYYKGKYEQRISAVQKLLTQIKKDTLQNGSLEELFVEFPQEQKEVVLKISFPVKR